MRTDLEPATPPNIPARQRRLPAGGRELHRRILRAFLDTGRAPRRPDLQAMAAELGLEVEVAMRGLSDIDLVHVDSDGRVVTAYPFSGRDTGVRVRLRNGPEIQAMCAIDALGIPPMSGRDAVIVATDPYSREPIRVESADGRWSWQPDHAVVLLADNGTETISADSTCPMITFHTTAENASTHLDDLPNARGRVLTQDEAIDIAANLFGGLLTSG